MILWWAFYVGREMAPEVSVEADCLSIAGKRAQVLDLGMTDTSGALLTTC